MLMIEKDKHKVLFVLNGWENDKGGRKKIITQVINNFGNRESLKLIILNLEPLKTGPDSYSTINNSVRLFSIYSKFKCRNYLYLFSQYLKFIKDERPDLIIDVCGPSLKIINAFLSTLMKRKYVIFDHEPSDILLGQSKFSFILKYFQPFAYRAASVVVGVNKDMVEHLSVKFKLSKTLYIPNPIDYEIIRKDKDKKIKFPFDENHKVIITACRIEPMKDLPTLIDSFEIVKKRIINARLLILGDGPQKKELFKYVERKKLVGDVVFAGFVENPYAYMARSNIFVSTSKLESFGLVLAEAMVCGLPVISTDCDFGPREILDRGKYGILVPVGDPAEISEAIIKVLYNEKFYRKKADLGFSRISRVYNPDKIYKEYEDIICGSELI